MVVKKESIKGTTISKRIPKKTMQMVSRINIPEDTYRDSVEKLAYDIWEKRGRQPSDGLSEWLEAEQMVKEKFRGN